MRNKGRSSAGEAGGVQGLGGGAQTNQEDKGDDLLVTNKKSNKNKKNSWKPTVRIMSWGGQHNGEKI